MLSVSQSADILNVSPSRVRAMIKSGVLPARKVGKSWVIEEEDVEKRLLAHPSSGRPKAKRVDPNTTNHEVVDIEEARDLYKACKELLRRHPDSRMLQSAKTNEEAAFYVAVSDFFLQQKQKELVAQGVY